MNKKLLTVYIFFISFSFCGNGFFIEDSKNSFFVNDWHDFTVLDKKGKYTKVKGKLIYQDPGNEEITYTLKNNRFGTFTLSKKDLLNIRFAMIDDQSITGIALSYDEEAGIITVRKSDSNETIEILKEEVRFIYFNYKNDNTRIAKFINVSNITSGGYILVKEKYNQPRTARYNLNCSIPGCEVTEKRNKKDNFMPNFIWKKFYKS